MKTSNNSLIDRKKKRNFKINFCLLLGLLVAFSLTSNVHGTVIDFTGGTVTQFAPDLGGVTNNANQFDNTDFYVENGMLFDFIGPSGDPFSYHLGDYYGVGNDVIHGHWADGPFGDMSSIRVNKLDNSAFDLNYFIVTTNTINGGGAAGGGEVAFINALADGTNVSATLPIGPDDWGFFGPNTQYFLPASFDNIKAFTITRLVGSTVGFGMDEFFIDEPPPVVPEPATLTLAALGLLGIGFSRRRRA